MEDRSSIEARSRGAPGGAAESRLAAAAGLVVAQIVVFVVGMRTPLGIAEWIVYLAPVAASMLLASPRLPLALASTSTVLIALGYFLSPPGALPAGIARMNRTIGVVVIWVVAAMVWRAVLLKLDVQRDRWLKAGQARLAESIRGLRDPATLAERVAGEVASRLGAQTAALFVTRDGERYELVGGYALPSERRRQRPAFAAGTGLVGQAARDRRMVRVDDVPAGYVTIESGLGAAPPRHLLLAPMLADAEVKAVLELGFVAAPAALHETFLGAIADTVGAAFQAAHYQEQLREALGRSQRQAEELRAQSEELRAANEELAQQAEALQDSQAKLEEQQAELEQSNHSLEDQANELRAQHDLLEERNQELGRTQAALEAKAVQLERASRYKSEFLASMSHELRTPLNSTLILARLLADNKAGNLTPEQVKYAETIYGAGSDLLTLINDVLDLSKVEAGKLEIAARPFSVAEMAAALEESFRVVAKPKGLAFAVVAPQPDAVLETDPGRLEQILRNLLSNAFKFTERGEVELRLSVDGERARFAVRDTGIGIAADQLERIFEPFEQAEGTARRGYGGTGLGLSISRRLARLLGGDLRVESAPGAGSVFTLEVPRVAPRVATPIEVAAIEPARPAATFATASLDERTRPMRLAEPAPPNALAALGPEARDDRDRLDPARPTVLVVEDDAHFAFVLSDVVHGLDAQCLVALDGTEGLALARRHHPDAIVLDIKLPDQSGLAVLDQLKASPETRHIPIHVLSVLDCERSVLEMGAVSYMPKPSRREELVAALTRLAERARRKSKKVLVVEDDRRQRDAIGELIEQETVRVVGVETAGEALRRIGEEAFDCVILDLGLPDMTGFELLEKLAAAGRAPRPPVIVYTGQSLSRVEEERLQRTARTIVLKGARSPERLLDEVTLFLHHVESELPAERQRMLAELRDRDRTLTGRRVLLVDDDVRNVYALTSILEEQQVAVRIARNGEEALAALERDPECDLVVMDIMMPVMDGYEAIERIRAQPRFGDLPILALTARAMPDDYDRCLRAGANDYLAKPVQAEKLVAMLRVWIARRRGLLH